MQLNDEQKKRIAQWAAEGKNLSEIQKEINNNFNISPTFMELRCLLIDEGIKLKDQEPSLQPEDLDLSAETVKEQSNTLSKSQTSGQVSIEIDRVKKAGAIVSGSVTFSDGVTATWSLDQLGRIALNASQAGYNPSKSDLQSFQQELARRLESGTF